MRGFGVASAESPMLYSFTVKLWFIDMQYITKWRMLGECQLNTKSRGQHTRFSLLHQFTSLKTQNFDSNF